MASIVLMSSACASGPVKRNLEDKARAAVADLVNDYENSRAEQFLERFSPGAFPDFDDFSARISDFLLLKRQISLRVVIDTVVPDEKTNGVAARFHWDRSFIDEAGAQRKDRGQCELLMVKEPFHGLFVTAVRGDSPF